MKGCGKINFIHFTHDHIETVLNYLNQSDLYKNDYSSEYNIANIYAWTSNDSFIFISDTYLIIKNKDYYFPPIAKDYKSYLEAVKDLAIYDESFEITGITKNFLIYDYEIVRRKDLDEYLYKPYDLIYYPGKKLKSKRNHLAKFNKEYKVNYKANANKEDLLYVLNFWKDKLEETNELISISRILDNLLELNCIIDIIYEENTPIAFSISSSYNNTAIILFEKANKKFLGAYQAICSFTVNQHYKTSIFINRQEDMGLANLRKSKRSYCPTKMIEKYTMKGKKAL